MPEGDTIFRTAATLRQWLLGRTVTGARDRVAGLHSERLVGCAVAAVETAGKNLLVRFEPGPLVLHTHMRMSGSWHVYSTGARWRRPERQMNVAVTCGDRLAVCFNAPVVVLDSDAEVARSPGLVSLGPDVLVVPFAIEEIVARARRRPPTTAIGELLLDQRVLSGIGNVYRAEALFACRTNPWTPIGALDDPQLAAIVTTAAAQMRANLGAAGATGTAGAVIGREFGAGPDRPWVYGRSGRTCRRCSTIVRSQPQGALPRTSYWCPACQPA